MAVLLAWSAANPLLLALIPVSAGAGWLYHRAIGIAEQRVHVQRKRRGEKDKVDPRVMGVIVVLGFGVVPLLGRLYGPGFYFALGTLVLAGIGTSTLLIALETSPDMDDDL